MLLRHGRFSASEHRQFRKCNSVTLGAAYISVLDIHCRPRIEVYQYGEINYRTYQDSQLDPGEKTSEERGKRRYQITFCKQDSRRTKRQRLNYLHDIFLIDYAYRSCWSNVNLLLHFQIGSIMPTSTMNITALIITELSVAFGM